MDSDQYYLLSVQISQYVQLLVQQFVMTHKHPRYHELASVCKENLLELGITAYATSLGIKVQNLPYALELLHDWELKLEDSQFFEDYISFVENEIEIEKVRHDLKRKDYVQFHPELMNLMLESKALIHPQLLPTTFSSCLITIKPAYLKSEENLIAIGLEQFVPYFMATQKFSKDSDVIAAALQQIQKYLIPTRDWTGLMSYVKKYKNSEHHSAIKYYFETGRAPRTEHCVLSEYKLLAPKDQPLELLPQIWKDYLYRVSYFKL
ncbi:hypothetical protein QAD02_001379 [Eretmocerus hayati]|uniref:Uncharacterized protein n=1 Tax=Eretmocerus hayati TaxID=131215 RepID=A0ACC2NFZ5_9HYME|nr:hypothetical protein QAD02_001379 [Eretmocerus hayati]